MDSHPPAALVAAKLRAAQRRLWAASAFANLALWGWLLLTVRPSAEPVVLHATLYFGVDRVGPWYHRYALPLAGAVVLALNARIAAAYRRREMLPGMLVAGATLAVQGLLWIAALTLRS